MTKESYRQGLFDLTLQAYPQACCLLSDFMESYEELEIIASLQLNLVVSKLGGGFFQDNEYYKEETALSEAAL